MSRRPDVERYRENWQDEVDTAFEYRALAASETDPRLARVYASLAKMEERHIAFWESRLRNAGAVAGSHRPSWRSRVLGWIARRFGPGPVMPLIAAKEEADQHVYDDQPETTGTGHARDPHRVRRAGGGSGRRGRRAEVDL